MPPFNYYSHFKVNREQLWDWLNRQGAFARLQPPSLKWKAIRLPHSLGKGEVFEFKFKKNGFWINWKGLHTDCKAEEYFIDEQVKGPFKKWKHHHHFTSAKEGSQIVDSIEYDLPFASLSNSLFKSIIERNLYSLFKFREKRICEDLERYRNITAPKGKVVLVTGHRGVIGSRLLPLLQMLGFEVRGLTRTPKASWEFGWDIEKSTMDERAIDGVHAIIHLAGSNIAAGRWTEKRKNDILSSRIESAKLLFSAIKKQRSRMLETFISASGVNYYFDDGKLSDEDGIKGNNFLAQVCHKWESSALAFEAFQCRVGIVRTGVVLDPLGGALSKMLLPFKMGLGGPLGNGNQYFPWISIDDLCDIYIATLLDESLVGPVNAVAPEVITQKEFSIELSKILRRPSRCSIHKRWIKLFLGQMGEELLLSNLKIVSKKLTDKNFKFRTPTIKAALTHLLKDA